MLYGLLLTVYIFVCILLTLIILVQKGKSSMGIGGLGGGSQMLFGGSGGQDIFQKTTWVLGTIFMAGALILSIWGTSESKKLHYVKTKTVATKSVTTAPAQTEQPTSEQ